MKVPPNTKQLYIDYFDLNYAFTSENLKWAFPDTYKIYVYNDHWSNDYSITDPLIGSELIRVAADSIIRTYLLTPGNIRTIK